MSVSRRHKIEAMLLDEPDDIFLRYSLAIELCGENEWETGHAMLVQLTHMTPPYVPAFFMIANLAVPKGLLDTARGALRDGIEERAGREIPTPLVKWLGCWPLLESLEKPEIFHVLFAH